MYVCMHKGEKKNKTKQNKRKRTHIEERCRTSFSLAKSLKIKSLLIL